jgi:hypothetical protein
MLEGGAKGEMVCVGREKSRAMRPILHAIGEGQQLGVVIQQ